jgi:hypothetical protein
MDTPASAATLRRLAASSLWNNPSVRTAGNSGQADER